MVAEEPALGETRAVLARGRGAAGCVVGPAAPPVADVADVAVTAVHGRFISWDGPYEGVRSEVAPKSVFEKPVLGGVGVSG